MRISKNTMPKKIKEIVLPEEETVTISKTKMDEIEAKLKMLYDVADKGRVYNYENQRAEKKPFKVKLSKFADGIIVGWRTIKDELVKHPTTGLTVGENQEYELKVLDSEGNTKLVNVPSYPAFSNARYNERIEVEVLGKKEDYEGKITFDVSLPDNKIVSIDARFIN
jgi:hypothetical protein